MTETDKDRATKRCSIKIEEEIKIWKFNGPFYSTFTSFFSIVLPMCIKFKLNFMQESFFSESLKDFRKKISERFNVKEEILNLMEIDSNVYVPYNSKNISCDTIIEKARQEWEQYENHIISLAQKSKENKSLLTEELEFLISESPEIDEENCVFMTSEIKIVTTEGSLIQTVTMFLVVCWKIDENNLNKKKVVLKVSTINTRG